MICEQRLYVNLWTQMRTILTGLPMYAYWPQRVFVHVEGIEVLACVSVCKCVHECVCECTCTGEWVFTSGHAQVWMDDCVCIASVYAWASVHAYDCVRMCAEECNRLCVYTHSCMWLRAHVHKFVVARECAYAHACTYAPLYTRWVWVCDGVARVYIHAC